MRWTVGRKLPGLSAVASALAVAVGVVGWNGTGRVHSDLQHVVAANAAQAQQAEVDASHDNVIAEVLMVLRANGDDELKDARSALDDDMQTIVEKVARPDRRRRHRGADRAGHHTAAASQRREPRGPRRA
jgi:hypothetical protein